MRVTHAAAPRRCMPVPPGTAQKSLGPFPSLVGQQPGHQPLFPQPGLGVPHLPSGLAPSRDDSSPLMLIKACRGTGQLQGCWKGALKFGGFWVEGSSRGLAARWARGGGAGWRGNLACRGGQLGHAPGMSPSTNHCWLHAAAPRGCGALSLSPARSGRALEGQCHAHGMTSDTSMSPPRAL